MNNLLGCRIQSGFIVLLASVLLLASSPQAWAAPPLRVCADPNYMPYSNQAGQGFENKVAELMSKALDRPLEYVWSSYRQSGGYDNFLALGLDKGKCDIVMNLPYGDPEEMYTRPYYGSSYVFVYRKSSDYNLSGGLDSPVLKKVKIGYEDNTPPQTGLKMRGLVMRAKVFHTAEKKNTSPDNTLRAVQRRKIDILITWEPAIGYYMKEFPDLTMARVPNTNAMGSPERYSFFMSMAVKPGDNKLKKQLDHVIATHQEQISQIMKQYNVRILK